MSSCFVFIGFLGFYFLLLPLVVQVRRPRCLRRFVEEYGDCEGYPKLLACLLAFSGVVFNVTYFACFPYDGGILLASVMAVVLLSTRCAVWMMGVVKRNRKMLGGVLVAIVLGIFNRYTFATAVLLWMVVVFSCMMVEEERTEACCSTNHEDGKEALKQASKEIATHSAVIQKLAIALFMAGLRTGFNYSDRKRPNRHGNASRYKRCRKRVSRNSISLSKYKYLIRYE